MGVVIPGYSADGLLANKASVDFREALQHEQDIKADANVRVTTAYFSYADVRPSLMLDGRVEAVRGVFPFDVREIEFLEEYLQPEVSIRYELTNEELAKLCLYGLFDHGTTGPAVPELFLDNIFEIPMQCDCAALPPSSSEDAPLLFVKVQDPYSMTTSSEESGYDIQAYFDIESEKVDDTMLDFDMSDEAELEDDVFIMDQEEIMAIQDDVPEVVEPEEEIDDSPTNEERELQSIFASIEDTLKLKRPKQASAPVIVEEQDIGIDDDDDDFEL